MLRQRYLSNLAFGLASFCGAPLPLSVAGSARATSPRLRGVVKHTSAVPRLSAGFQIISGKRAAFAAHPLVY
jgi:hypothetical protein